MSSHTNIQNINAINNKENMNQKDASDLSNIDNSDLYLFLQFYFSDAQKNLKKILSNSVITTESELPKITSSFNFWLNFALNFKDNSFVEMLLNEGTKADYCKKSLKQILEDIVKFLYEHFRSEEAFNKIMKQNYNKLYELILRLKEIVDNVYESALRNEIFINIKEEEKKNEEEEEENNKNNQNSENNLKRPNMAENDDEDLANNQFNNNSNNNLNNIIDNNNIMINNIKIINNNQENADNNINIPSVENTQNNQSNMIVENDEKGNLQINQENNIDNKVEIQPYKISSPSLDIEEIRKLFYNFCYFTNFNLRYFQVVFYEKVGYAFLDYNGNFLWADDYTSYILFEEENIKKINLFNIMTDFSKYILKKKYKDKFFDFQDENNRMRIFTYTIDNGKIKEKESIKLSEKLYEELNKIKTLVSRATPVLLTGQNGSFVACILLETKISFYRQNFDFFYWKSDWNNQ